MKFRGGGGDGGESAYFISLWPINGNGHYSDGDGLLPSKPSTSPSPKVEGCRRWRCSTRPGTGRRVLGRGREGLRGLRGCHRRELTPGKVFGTWRSLGSLQNPVRSLLQAPMAMTQWCHYRAEGPSPPHIIPRRGKDARLHAGIERHCRSQRPAASQPFVIPE